jgi:hypothetical protein
MTIYFFDGGVFFGFAGGAASPPGETQPHPRQAKATVNQKPPQKFD